MTFTIEQKKIIFGHKTGPAIVGAGPGTGKSFTLCHRVMNLVDQGCPPERIQLLTFSQVAKENLMAKLHDDLRYEKVRCSTFHSFGFSIIKEHWRELGFTCKPKFVKDNDLKKVVDEIIQSLGKNNRNVKTVELKKAVAKARKLNKATPEHGGLKSALSKAVVVVLERLRDYKLENNLVEFYDMLDHALDLIARSPTVTDAVALKIDHLLVDELQDISSKEVNLIFGLAKRVQSTLLVGDKKQAIYSFRGSDLKCWDKLERKLNKHFKLRLKYYYLTKSHRVPKQALRLINTVAVDICDDPALTSEVEGFRPLLYIAESNDSQSAFTAKKINALVAQGASLEDIAILGRTKKSLYSIKNHLSHFGVETIENYRISTATTEKVLRALIRITRFIAQTQPQEGKKTGISCQRPRSRLPKKSLTRVLSYLGLPKELLSELSQDVLDNDWDSFWVPKSTGERLYRGVHNLRRAVYRAAELIPEAGVQILIDALSRFIHHRFGKETALIKRDLSLTKILMKGYHAWSEIDLKTLDLAYSKSGVQLHTIHGAKGKEWPYVFLINVVEKYLPFYFNGKCEFDEELRLYYVAITRASQKTYIITSPVIGTKFAKKGSAKKWKLRDVLKEESIYITSYRNLMKLVK